MDHATPDKRPHRCFYINLPIGLLTALFIFFFFHPTKKAKALSVGWKARLEQFDLFGTLVFLPMIVCLLLALQWGGSKYPWSDGRVTCDVTVQIAANIVTGRIIACLVLFGVLCIIFVGIQFWKQDNATVPPRVFKQRTVASSAWFGAALGASFFVFVYYLPIWFQAIKGASATKSGIMSLPMILGLVIMSLVAGGMITTFGYYTPFLIASAVLMSVGSGLLTTLRTDTGHAKWIGFQVIFGFGVGFGMVRNYIQPLLYYFAKAEMNFLMQQNTLIAVQTVLPKQDIPTGIAIVMFSQILGGALFISVAQNIFTNRLLSNLQAAIPDLDPSVVLATGATQLKTVIGNEYLSRVLTAYNDALTQCFYVGVAMACLSAVGALAVEWKSVKGKKIEMGVAA